MSLLFVSKATILTALSRALDLVEGQPPGHALRTAHIAVRLAEALQMPEEAKEDLYFAALLKDSGCSNNSVRIQKIFGGDEHLAKRAVKLIDWSSTTESLKFAWQNTERGQTLVAKLRRMASNLGPPTKVMNEVTEARCTRGAAIASLLNFRVSVAGAILYLDEHWDGKGAPYGKREQEIPALARILGFAQTFEIFLATFGLTEALDMAKGRSGSWFEPQIVKALDAFANDSAFWEKIGDEDFSFEQLPQLHEQVLDSDVDGICEAFAMIVDAKSSFTAEHSTRVMQYSVALADHFDFEPHRRLNLRRAALLHDIGKLGVPTGILEKPGRLDATEFDRIKLHPENGYRILSEIPGFEYAAEIASSHHEKLDGTGYWQGKKGDELSLDVRIVTVCDVFDALTAKRPYRDPMPLALVHKILTDDIGVAFDGDCVAAIKEIVQEENLPIAA
ncbi:MAG: HD domain-containing protein [Chthonomonas sp.]|nr:HD domain-containing protein [Chthonomonas sp.]